MRGLAGRVVLVTGAASGIGQASRAPRRRAGRGGARMAELAGVIGHLLSDDASYVTGQVIAVDGGATVR